MATSSNGSFSPSSNSTSGDLHEQKEARQSYEAALSTATAVLMSVVMFSMGCTVEVKKLWGHMKKPWGIAVGLACQFGLMPLTAYLLTTNLVMKPAQAIAILIIGCCPGGAFSNIITYWSDGDMDLSISMTALSSIAALGMMPLCLYLYTHSWEFADDITVPYKALGTSLLGLIAPVACGMFVNYKWAKQSKIILKVGGNLGGLCVIAAAIANMALYEGSWHLDPTVLMVVAVFPFIGYFSSFLLAILTRQSWPRCRTIAVETGTQNIHLCLTVFQLSFGSHHLMQIMLIPLLYGIFQLLCGVLTVAACKIHKKCLRKADDEKPPESSVNLWNIPTGEINVAFEKEGESPVRSRAEKNCTMPL